MKYLKGTEFWNDAHEEGYRLTQDYGVGDDSVYIPSILEPLGSSQALTGYSMVPYYLYGLMEIQASTLNINQDKRNNITKA